MNLYIVRRFLTEDMAHVVAENYGKVEGICSDCLGWKTLDKIELVEEDVIIQSEGDE